MQRLLLILLVLSVSLEAKAYQPAPPIPVPFPVYAATPPAFSYPPLPYRVVPYWYRPAYAPVEVPAATETPAIDSSPAQGHRQDVPAEQVDVHRAPAMQGLAGDRQQAFLDTLLPIVLRENARLRRLRAEVGDMLDMQRQGGLSEGDSLRLRQLARRYRVEGKILEDAAVGRELLKRIDSIPAELALAQAANESAWGTSRFAREGNNLFGIWTYDKDKGIVPKRRAEGATHLVRRFDSFDQSVRYYLHTLNSHPAYQDLRETRAAMRARGEQPSGVVLAGGLTRYSAKGELYVKLIRDLINRYRLASVVGQGAPNA